MRKRNDIYINDKGSDDFRAKPTLPLFSFYPNLLKRECDRNYVLNNTTLLT